MKRWQEEWRKLSPFFLDIWQYLLIIIAFIIAAVIFL